MIHGQSQRKLPISEGRKANCLCTLGTEIVSSDAARVKLDAWKKLTSFVRASNASKVAIKPSTSERCRGASYGDVRLVKISMKSSCNVENENKVL
jgi:hypothetical protein